jgi:hypothetical protein
MKAGYYKLTQDVRNPKPDRRSKRRLDAAEVWPAGTIVFITDRREGVLRQAENAAGERLGLKVEDIAEQGEIRFNDNTQVLYTLEDTDWVRQHPECIQGNGILTACEPATKTLGQVLKQSDWNADALLALLIDTGKITLEDVDALKKHDLTPDAPNDDWKSRDKANDDFYKKHGLS